MAPLHLSKRDNSDAAVGAKLNHRQLNTAQKPQIAAIMCKTPLEVLGMKEKVRIWQARYLLRHNPSPALPAFLRSVNQAIPLHICEACKYLHLEQPWITHKARAGKHAVEYLVCDIS